MLGQPNGEILRDPWGRPALLLRGRRIVGGVLDWAYFWGLVELWMRMWDLLRAPEGCGWDWRWEALHSLHWRAVSLRPSDMVGWDRQAIVMAVICWSAAHRLLPSGLLSGGVLLRSDGSRASWMIGFLRQCARLLNYKFLWLWGIAILRPDGGDYWMQTRGIQLFSFLVLGNAVCFLLRGAMLHDTVFGIAQCGGPVTTASLSQAFRKSLRLFVLPSAVVAVGLGPLLLKWWVVRVPPDNPPAVHGMDSPIQKDSNPW